MNLTDIVRRSSLIMPVNQPYFVENAYLRGAEKPYRLLSRAQAIAVRDAPQSRGLRMAGVT
jgi:hypothetical protein